MNLTLPPRRAATAQPPASERDPAAYADGFQAGAAAERAKLSGAAATSWDEIAAELNAEAGVSAPTKEV